MFCLLTKIGLPSKPRGGRINAVSCSTSLVSVGVFLETSVSNLKERGGISFSFGPEEALALGIRDARGGRFEGCMRKLHRGVFPCCRASQSAHVAEGWNCEAARKWKGVHSLIFERGTPLLYGYTQECTGIRSGIHAFRIILVQFLPDFALG